MERKIGEIFEYNGEWYQCLKSPDGSCKHCDMDFEKCPIPIKECTESGRSDNSYVIFKKLEKVGEPYMLEDKKFQKYRVFHTPYIYHKIDYSWQSFADPYYVSLEIKQTKKDMEENHKAEDTLLTRLVGRYVNNLLDYKTFEEAVKELYSDKEESKPALKEFDLEAAKSGKPVCTRDGREARIICFDAKLKNYSIVALVKEKGSTQEYLHTYTNEGRIYYKNPTHSLDLVMPLKKKTGWVNIFANGEYTVSNIYTTEQSAKVNAIISKAVDTIQIEWYE